MQTCGNTKMRPRLQVSNINIIFMFANVCADCIQIYLRSIFAGVIFAIYLHRLVCISGLL